jgi:hypothetical protein
LTQAPFAARRARGLIDRLRVDLEAKNMRGMLGMVDLDEARLLVHQRRNADASEVIQRIYRRLRQANLEALPAPVVALKAEIGHS